jgi:predicted deacylase
MRDPESAAQLNPKQRGSPTITQFTSKPGPEAMIVASGHATDMTINAFATLAHLAPAISILILCGVVTAQGEVVGFRPGCAQYRQRQRRSNDC